MKEEFEMYAIMVDNPFIVEENDIENFFENSKKQEGIAEKLASVFNKEWFDFKPDKNGIMTVSMNVGTKD